MYMSTGKMAEYLGVSIKFLKENKDFLFKKGTHYFIPAGRVYPMWCVNSMLDWVKGSDDRTAEIIKRMV